MTTKKHLSSDHIDLIREALREMRSASEEHANTMRQAVEAGGIEGFMTKAAAQGMLETHERREREFEILANALEQAQDVTLTVEPCDECEQDICVCDYDLEGEDIRDFQLG